ncbi:GNAT family N-acetyltransferase [Rhizobium sp. YIM 134829]|uniref:GNAT family N-acetyltransferase n=1 Tax=Rhizobium sp. YIM 134829 TaxID=3390453 RepID=UPI00397AE6CA
MVSVGFRTASATDYLSIANLHVRISSEAYASTLPSDYLAEVMPREKIELWERRLAPPVRSEELSITLAEVHTDLIGFACFVFSEETHFGSYLHNLYVDPAFQGNRLGPRLLIESIDRFPSERRETPVHLLTMRENYQARRFYERLGGALIEEKQSVMSRYPEIIFVRYQWPSALVMASNALALSGYSHRASGR